MSTATLKYPLNQAKSIAAAIVRELEPAVERIQTAGSIRRQRPDVGDIDILCIPRRPADMFGNPDTAARSELDAKLDTLKAEGRLTEGRCNGEKLKSLLIPRYPGLKLEIYCTTPDAWAVVLAIRTGPEEFSRALVTEKQYGGALPNGHRVSVADGAVLDRVTGDRIEIKTEDEFLRFCGLETALRPEMRRWPIAPRYMQGGTRC